MQIKYYILSYLLFTLCIVFSLEKLLNRLYASHCSIIFIYGSYLGNYRNMLLNASVSCREKVYPCTTKSSILIRNYVVKTAKCNHICISGHLLAYEFTGSYHKYDCHLLSLFDAPISKQYLDENYVKIKRTLEREVQILQRTHHLDRL